MAWTHTVLSHVRQGVRLEVVVEFSNDSDASKTHNKTLSFTINKDKSLAELDRLFKVQIQAYLDVLTMADLVDGQLTTIHGQTLDLTNLDPTPDPAKVAEEACETAWLKYLSAKLLVDYNLYTVEQANLTALEADFKSKFQSSYWKIILLRD